MGYCFKKRRARVAQTARSESQQDGASGHAEGVVPIEELETVVRAHLERVGPGTPAQHAEDH